MNALLPYLAENSRNTHLPPKRSSWGLWAINNLPDFHIRAAVTFLAFTIESIYIEDARIKASHKEENGLELNATRTMKVYPMEMT